jgi:two-component system, LytTR family, response regulator
MQTLLLPTSDKILCLNIESIVRVEASSNYSKVYYLNQPYPIVACKVLRWFEDHLPQESFFRVHRTHLINRKYLAAIKNDSVILESGELIGISRRKRKLWMASL